MNMCKQLSTSRRSGTASGAPRSTHDRAPEATHSGLPRLRLVALGRLIALGRSSEPGGSVVPGTRPWLFATIHFARRPRTRSGRFPNPSAPHFLHNHPPMSESTIAETPTAAPSRVPTITVWFMAAATGVIVANNYFIQPLEADIARTFGLSVTKIGFVAMLAQIGTALGMLLFVPLGDSKERRSTISLLVIGAAASLILVATAGNAVWLALACFVLGAMCSSVHLFVPFAAHLAPSEQRG